MKKVFGQVDLKQLEKISEEILHIFPNQRVFAFSGNLGTGKTTFIKLICKKLGLNEPLSSPTYAIAHVYLAKEEIYHVDLYRLSGLDEAIEAGIEEYIDGRHYCFIEWPEIIKPLLPQDTVMINMSIYNQNKRIIEINCNE